MFNIFKKNQSGDHSINDLLDINIQNHLKGLEEKSNMRLEKITKTLDLVEQLTDDAKKDQDNLKIERDIWKATFNAIPNLIVILDKDQRVVRVNQSFLNHTEKLEQDVLGLSCNNILDNSFCDCGDKCYIDGILKLDFKTCLFKDKFYTISYVPIRSEDNILDGHILQYQEITDRVEKQQMLNRRDSIMDAINSTAEKMLKDTTAQNGFRIEQMISKLGKAADVSRVTIYQNKTDSNNTLYTSQKYEWCNDGVEEQKRNPLVRDINFNNIFPRWVNALSKGQSIYGHIIDFPESEQIFLRTMAIKSCLCVPIYVSDVWDGFMRIDYNDEKLWQEPEIHAFQLAANVLGSWIERGKVESSLRELIRNSNPHKKKLGEYIIEEGLLSQEDLDDILKKQEKEVADDPNASSYKYVCINLT